MFKKAEKDKYIQSAYRASFMAPASPFRHWRERCGMPRPRWPWGGKTLRARYTKEELAAGYRIIDVGPYRGSDPEKAARWTGQLLVENKPLTDETLLWHVAAPDRQRGKSWLLTHYGPDALLDACYIDIDLHFSAGWNFAEQRLRHVDEAEGICVHVPESSPEEVQAAIDQFWNQTAQVQAVFDRLGIEPMWITSPGDIWRDEHLQGLHVWLRLEQPLPRDELAARMASFARHHGIAGEIFPCLGTSQNPELLDRAVRLPGQPYQNLVNADIDNRSIIPVCSDADYVNQFMTVVNKWECLSPVPLCLLPEAQKPKTEDSRDSISLPSHPPKYMSTPTSPPPRPGQEQDTGDTLALIRQVAARVVRAYRGRKDIAGEIEQEATKQVRRLVSRSSTTCNTPGLLEAKVKAVVEYYLSSYEPMKAARQTIRLADDYIIRPLKNVSTAILSDVLASRGVSDRVNSFLVILLRFLIVQHGRIAVRRRSKSMSGMTLSELAGSRRQWDRIRGEVMPLLKVVERGHTGTCSLITLADDLLAEVAACTSKREELTGAG